MLSALIKKITLIYKKPKIFVQADKNWCQKNKIINYRIQGLPLFSLISNFPIIRTICNRIFYDWFIAKNKIDLIIFGGGSTLKYNKVIKNFYNIILKCKKYNKDLKVVGCGVSIGPFSNNKSIIQFNKLKRFVDYWWVRDSRSSKLLTNKDRKKNYFTAPDLAFLYYRKIKNLSIKKKKSSTKNVLICLRSKMYEKKQKELLYKLFNILGSDKKKYNVIFVNFCTFKKTSDTIFARKIISELELKKNISFKFVDYNENIIRIFSIFKKADIIFAVRYHAVICSMLFGKIPYIFSYDSKVDDLIKDNEIKNKHLWSNLTYKNLNMLKNNYNTSKKYKDVSDSLKKIFN